MIGSTPNPGNPPPPEAGDAPDTPGNPVFGRLRERILRDGPVSVATFMQTALSDPDGGYYTTRDPFGVAGDFTTSPEISQMFGELVGLWCVDTWQKLGAPGAFALVELGPGRGTLMADALRAMQQVPACRSAASVHLVETSPTLREIQQRTLHANNVTWHTGLPDLGRTPTIFIANEFLDALPVNQYVKRDGRWCERVVAFDHERERLCFALDRTSGLPAGSVARELSGTRDGDTFEYSPSVRATVSDIAYHLFLNRGAALIIDYGHTRHATGLTMQAVRRHRPIDPLELPGDCDLTAHVDFQLVAETARAARTKVFGPVDQGAFLQRLGIVERANALLKRANVSQALDIRAALNRLISPKEMGVLFKVMAIGDEQIEHLAGFPADD
ncbi:MAG: SAM-dependent methyltransferase [Alphaproteobacteria bacterium]|nr:SAM-dependent methyltransferase [Alphaproteobacteria bacterium]